VPRRVEGYARAARRAFVYGYAVQTWLEIRLGDHAERHALAPGLTRVGGPRADVVLPGWGDGELHFWSDPPKVVDAGGGPALVRRGARVEEAPLADGDELLWGAARIVLRREAAVLEEIPLEPVPPAAPAGPRARAPADARAWRLLQAGLLVDLGLADKALVRRWQEAVRRSEFDPDACSRELLAEGALDAADRRVLDRCALLLRDLLMAPLLRGASGAGRRARGAARSGLAFVIAQVLALAVYSLILAALMVLVRVRWDVSFDGWIDALLGR
jgi:hypothetical protein